jgi:NifB/MoaA-like Fe-S oxidoreductase
VDLYALSDRMQSVSVVPVGLTGHRRGLTELRSLTPAEAGQVVRLIESRQRFFRGTIGRGFVYASDEMYILAGLDFPEEGDYDGYPLMENGVGMCRDFLDELHFQASELPASISPRRRLTMVTGTLAGRLLSDRVRPELQRVAGLDVQVVVAENRLFGPSVTVSGLLNWRSLHGALAPLAEAGELGDHVLLPPDCVNVDGRFLDERPAAATPADLSNALGVPVSVFGGDWAEVITGPWQRSDILRASHP